jgi:hypothetical protein
LTAKLIDLGFFEGIVAETVVSTYNKNGKPNAAPIGIIMEDGHLMTKLFNSALTHNSIKTKRCAVINLTSDIEIFYKTAFKETNIGGKLPEEWFEPAKTVNAPKLRLADAAIEVSATSLTPIGTGKTKVNFEVKLIHAPNKYPQVHCRAMSATLEAIIHATRVKLFVNDEKQQALVSKLLEMIANCNDVVDHTAPHSPYSLVMADLKNLIDSWRSNR